MKTSLILKSEETEKEVIKLITLMNNNIDGIKTLFHVMNLDIKLLKNLVIKYNLSDLFELLEKNSVISEDKEREYNQMCIYYENIEMYEKTKCMNISMYRQFNYAIKQKSEKFIYYFIDKMSPDELNFSLLLEIIKEDNKLDTNIYYLNKMKISTNDVFLLNEVIKLKNLTIVEKLLLTGVEINTNTICEAYKTNDKLLFELVLKHAIKKNLNNYIIEAKEKISKNQSDNGSMYLFDLYV